MPNLNCIIIDDDLISIKILEALIDKTEFLTFKGSFITPLKAYDFLEAETVDIIFLDIEMPDMTGLEFLESLTFKSSVIITSSKEEYALDAFNFDVVDYLLKPIHNYGRFVKAVMKVADKRNGKETISNENIYVKVDSLLVNLDLNQVLWVEAYGDYVKIVTADKTFVVYTKLKRIEQKLPKTNFLRIHRSYIVNLTRIQNIDHSNLQIENNILPISSTYKEGLINALNLL